MAHALKFDTTTRPGTAIVELFDGIKTHIEDSDGGWNGGDVVDALTDWFVALGFDVHGAPVGTPSHLPDGRALGAGDGPTGDQVLAALMRTVIREGLVGVDLYADLVEITGADDAVLGTLKGLPFSSPVQLARFLDIDEEHITDARRAVASEEVDGDTRR